MPEDHMLDRGPGWRRFGRQRRLYLLYSSDDCGSALPFCFKLAKLTEKCPIETYYDLGDEMLLAFQATHEKTQSSSKHLDDAYVLGHLLMKFLSTTVCAHTQYTSSLPGHIKLRQRSLDIRELLRSSLNQISEDIDNEEFERATKDAFATNEKTTKQEDDAPTVSITLSDDAENAPNIYVTTGSSSSEGDYIKGERNEAPSSSMPTTKSDECPSLSRKRECTGYPMQEKKPEVYAKVENGLPSRESMQMDYQQERHVVIEQTSESEGWSSARQKPSSTRIKELIAQWQSVPKRLQVEDMTQNIPTHRWAADLSFAVDDVSDLSIFSSFSTFPKENENHRHHAVEYELHNRMPKCNSEIDSAYAPECNQDNSLERKLEMTQERLAESEVRRIELQSEVDMLRKKLYGRVDPRGLDTSTCTGSPSRTPPQEIIICPSKTFIVPSTDFGEI